MESMASWPFWRGTSRYILIGLSFMLLALLGQGSINYLDKGPDTALAVGSCTTSIGESTCKDGKIIVCQCTEPSKQEGCRMVDTGSTCGVPAQPQRASFVNNCQGRANGESTCLDGQIKVCRCFSDGCSLENTGSTCGGQGSPAPAGGQGGSAQQTSSASCPAGSTNCVAQSQTATGGNASVGDITAGGGQGGNATTGPVTSNPSQSVTTGSNSQTQNTGSTTQTTGSVSQTANPTQNQTQTASPNITVNVPPQAQGAVQVREIAVAQTQHQPQVVRVAAAPVTELPKTGLPELAWAVVSFLPLGLKIRNFKKAQGLSPQVDTDSPNLMLLKRQLSK